MSFVRRFILIGFVLVSCVGCDQTTKSIAKSVLSESEKLSYLGDTIRLQLVYNKGAFMSLGSSLPTAWREGVFTIGVMLFLIGVLVYGFLFNPGRFSGVLAVAQVFSGGIGNLFDRFAYDGAVVDFINIGIGPVRTGIFNVADIAITAGVLIFFSEVLRQQQKKR